VAHRCCSRVAQTHTKRLLCSSKARWCAQDLRVITGHLGRRPSPSWHPGGPAALTAACVALGGIPEILFALCLAVMAARGTSDVDMGARGTSDVAGCSQRQ
jgi:hypothetical protein